MIELHGKLDELIEQLDNLHMYPDERRVDNFVMTIYHADEIKKEKPHKSCLVCKKYMIEDKK